MKPILFSTPMVQAILDGRKTQTRRVIKRTALQWLENDGFSPAFVADKDNGLSSYAPGDILWVRETWYSVPSGPKAYVYKADNTQPESFRQWRPSIRMPKEAARLFLRVTDVRVQRVQDISEGDAADEGVRCVFDGIQYDGYRDAFSQLWDSLNAKRGYGWAANPWVWAYTFEQVDKL